MVDIEINAWSSLLLNLETNLILYLYPVKCINSTNQSRVIEAWKFEILRAIKYYQTETGLRDSLILNKPVFDFFTKSKKKGGLGKKLKGSTLDIRTKQSVQSVLKVSHSKVPSSGQANVRANYIRQNRTAHYMNHLLLEQLIWERRLTSFFIHSYLCNWLSYQ